MGAGVVLLMWVLRCVLLLLWRRLILRLGDGPWVESVSVYVRALVDHPLSGPQLTTDDPTTMAEYAAENVCQNMIHRPTTTRYCLYGGLTTTYYLQRV